MQECCEEWSKCELASGDSLPDDLIDYQAVVLTGSRFNCRDGKTLPWFEPLCDFIRKAAESGKPKIYGGCFGCQVIAHALGGKVDYNPKGNFVLKAEDVKLDTYVFNNFLDAVNKDSLCLISSHGDCVSQLPPNSDLLGYSASCEHEMFITGSGRNILAVQSHPEFDYQYSIAERVWPAVVETRNKLAPDEIAESKETFAKYNDEDAKILLQVVAKFLRQ